MMFAYHRWTRVIILSTITVGSLLFSVVCENIYVKLIILFPAFCYFLFETSIEMLVALTFIAPQNRKKQFDQVNWQSTIHQCSTKIHTMSYFDSEKRPLIIIIHGWRSGAISMFDRAKKYIDMGMHVIIFEMPGHGASEPISKWTAGHATTTFIEFFSSLDSKYDINNIAKIYFHGHSIGAFLLLKFSNYIHDMKCGDMIDGFIFESPMTCYSMIFQAGVDRYRIPKLLLPIYWKRLKQHFNAINPKLDPVNDLSDVDVPRWGQIRHNLLIIQAGNDKILGMKHYEKLVESQFNSRYYSKMENHVINNLTHSGARKNDLRDNLIESWFQKLSHSDSVKSA